MVYWFTPRAKNTKDISIWHSRNFETIGCTLSKCEISMKQIPYLSHIILKVGMSMDSSKIQDMLSWNAPASIVDVHSFLGLV
jgi:hypothetical protein